MIQPNSDTTADAPIISADSLSKTFKEGWVFKKKINALTCVSFAVNKGEAFGLLGPNGAGKTTFIKILLGIVRKSAGSASLLGYPAGSLKGRQFVGYLPEQLRVPPHMTGHMALECFGNLANVPNRIIRQRRGELLSMVGLADRGRDRVRKYSKGMVQRLGIAQALLNEPKLLILDEPTDGLDPRARAEVREVIRGLTEKGVTIFLNSHLLGEVESTCDRVAILDRGELKYCGGVNEIGDFIGAHQGEIEVQIRIKADLGAAQAAFQDTNFQITEKHSDSEFGVTARFANQEGIDALLDRLLKNKISLISLQRKQISLEDAFLRIVDDPANKATIRNYLK